MKSILVVDDSLSVRESLRMIFKDNFNVITSDFTTDPRSFTEPEDIDITILGISHPLKSKLEFFQKLIDGNENTAFLLIIEKQGLKDVVDIFDYNVSDFMFKPFSVYTIRERVEALLTRKAFMSLHRDSHETVLIDKYRKFLHSPLLEKKVLTLTSRAHKNDAPILIQGENGTGHEWIAKAIHYNGFRNEEDFIRVDCSHLSDESFINTLLPTREVSSSHSSGTLFLEGIEKANATVQMKLMEIIEEQAIKTDGKKEAHLNIRVIASTFEDLRGKVNNGEFREDLFYSLNTIPINLSPLRERIEDIPVIADYILDDVCQRIKSQKKNLSSDAITMLQNYYWPGNLFELQSVVYRSAILTDKEKITGAELAFGLDEKAVRILEDTEETAQSDVRDPVKEDEKKTVDVSLDTLITNLAHEFKNPMVSIKTFTQLLPERFDDEEFRNQFYKIVGANVDKIDSFMETIVHYTQFSKLKFCSIDIRTIVEKALEKNLGGLAEKVQNILRAFPEDIPPILSDKNQLQYVFDILLSRIVSMMPEGEELTLSAKVSDSNLEELSNVTKLEQMDNKLLAIRIPLPSSETTTFFQTNAPPILSLEFFLAERLINKNLGIMELKETGQETILEIKLPVALSKHPKKKENISS